VPTFSGKIKRQRHCRQAADPRFEPEAHRSGLTGHARPDRSSEFRSIKAIPEPSLMDIHERGNDQPGRAETKKRFNGT